MKKKVSMTMLALAIAVVGHAQIVDGTKDASYGSAIAVQTINTAFGQANGSAGGGSELDAVYGKISGSTLYLMFTGDLEGNYNHLDLWFDTGASGMHTITGNSGLSNPFNGMVLSNGFNASQFITLNGGLENGDNHVYVDQSTDVGGTWTDSYLGMQAFTGAGTLSGGTNPFGIQVGVNDSNVAVQTGSGGSAITNTAALLAVNTGIEFGIPLAALGNPTGAIKIIAEVNGNGDNYLSNQFFSGLPVGTGNLGGPGSVNLSQYGNPYFTVQPAPEPATMVGIALGVGALLRRRRKA